MTATALLFLFGMQAGAQAPLIRAFCRDGAESWTASR